MKVDLVYWVDKVGSVVDRMSLEIKPFGYRMAPVTQWELLIADEDVKVEKGKMAIIRIKPVSLPENTLIGPLNIMRHALGTVVDVIECGLPKVVEKEKCINQVLFMPIEDGEIKTDDLLGVLKVFHVKTGIISKVFNLSPPKVEIKGDVKEFNLTWRDDGNVYRRRIRTKVFGYERTHIGYWELLIAEENVKFNKGDVFRIKVREVVLPRNTIVVPLSFMRNAYGVVLDVVQLGEPAKVEEEKIIKQAIFLAVDDGVIEKGDLVGILNVYFVGVKNIEDLEKIIPEKKPEKVKMVYRSGEGVVKKEIIAEPFSYKRKDVARWEVVVADESVNLKKDEPVFVKIKPIEVPKRTILYPMSIMRHAFGVLLDVYSYYGPWKVEDGGRLTHAIYYPIMDGRIRKGEMLGILNMYSVEVGFFDKIKEYFSEYYEEYVKATLYSRD